MSRLRRLRPYFWFILAVSLVGAALSLAAVVMAVSLSGAPNYSVERAIYNRNVWGTTFILAAVLAVGSIVVLVRSLAPRSEMRPGPSSGALRCGRGRSNGRRRW